MDPSTSVPDRIPDDVLAEHAEEARRSVELSWGDLREALTTVGRAGWVELLPERQWRSLLVAGELGAIGALVFAFWWTWLAFSSGYWLWAALAVVGWALAIHLPLVLIGLYVTRRRERRPVQRG